jgi:hypothetical protein
LQSGQDFLALVRARGARGVLDNLEIETESGGLVRISGPIEVSPAGNVSGKLSIDLTDPDRLIQYAQSVFPPSGEVLSNISAYLQAFAETSDGKVVIEGFQLDIRDGEVFAGFFKIGEIPRIF